MVQRLPLIAALVIVEFAIVGGIFIAIRGSAVVNWPIHRHQQHDTGNGSDSGSSYSFVTGSAPALTIDVGYADVAIVTQSAGNVDVTVPGDRLPSFMGALAPITATADGDTVRVVAQQGHWSMFGDPRVVRITVPVATRVTIQNAGNISATGLRAEASLSSVRGDITVDDFNAPALHLAASDGHMTLHAIVADLLEATSSNGRVEATGLQVRDGHVVSSNGRITLGFRPGADTVVSAATSNGMIKVSGLDGGAAVRSGGDDDDDDANARTVRVGAGEGRLDVHASNGNINLSQEG
jgi:hypothetical protein